MNKIILRTYNNLWKTPFKIYSIDNLKLIIPVNPWDVLVFAICLVLMVLLDKVLFFVKIPFILKYALAPWAMTKIVDTVKLDGKKPYKYFIDMVRFFLAPKQYERFKVFKTDKLIGFREKFIIRKPKELTHTNKAKNFTSNALERRENNINEYISH